ncbi:MAG: HupE/UreJ family protein [Deltaproteobacteria bacterium]|nr:MAG: HupE/UreJ family protein [Deltaproteobacteria bacterium]
MKKCENMGSDPIASHFPGGTAARVLALALALTLTPTPTQAHPLSPSSLALTEDADGVSLVWRTPAVALPGVRLAPEVPEGCSAADAGTEHVADGAIVRTQRLACPAGLAGATVGVARIGRAPTPVLVSARFRDGHSASGVIDAGHPRWTVPGAQPKTATLTRYGVLGIFHLWTGFDHVLFVLGLVVLVRGRRLVWAVTAFTVGHSATLGLAVLGLLDVPSAPVEVGIALSLVLVALEIVHQERARFLGVGADAAPAGGVLSRRPWLVSGAFGLLHGLGFAGALGDAGLPADQVPLALLGFNVGVELGQLAVVAVALAAGFVLLRLARAPRVSLALGAAYVIGCLGAFWVLQRSLDALG